MLTVVFPGAQIQLSPTTNNYLVDFTSINSGQIQGPTNSEPQQAWPLGVFVRNTNFIGQTLAPSRLVTGDEVLISNATSIFPQTLLMDSTNA